MSSMLHIASTITNPTGERRFIRCADADWQPISVYLDVDSLNVSAVYADHGVAEVIGTVHTVEDFTPQWVADHSADVLAAADRHR